MVFQKHLNLDLLFTTPTGECPRRREDFTISPDTRLSKIKTKKSFHNGLKHDATCALRLSIPRQCCNFSQQATVDRVVEATQIKCRKLANKLKYLVQSNRSRVCKNVNISQCARTRDCPLGHKSSTSAIAEYS